MARGRHRAPPRSPGEAPRGDTGAAMLSHPSIVRVFDQGEENGTPYAVFEYLPGGSLEQRLAAGPLSESEAQEVATDLAAALTYAHAQGVTHGSIEPANVLLDAEGRAKLAGFGGGATPEEDTRALGALLATSLLPRTGNRRLTSRRSWRPCRRRRAGGRLPSSLLPRSFSSPEESELRSSSRPAGRPRTARPARSRFRPRPGRRSNPLRSARLLRPPRRRRRRARRRRRLRR